jgi:hypothetical protein
MKNKKRFYLFIALLAVIALAMAACFRDIPNNTDWIVKAKDKSGSVMLYGNADAKTFQTTIPDGSVVKGTESAGSVIGESGWPEYIYKVEYEGKTYYIKEKDLRKQTKGSKAVLAEGNREFKDRKKKEWQQFGIWLGMVAVVFTGLYFWNRTRTIRALRKYYAKKRREFQWLDNYIKQKGDPSVNRAVNDSAQSVVMSIFVSIVLMIITYLIGKLNFTVVMVYMAISIVICVIMGIKNTVSPGKLYYLDIQDLTLECPSCHCPHSWGMKSKEVTVESEATIVETTKRDGYEDKTERGGTAYGVKTIIDFVCLNCGHSELNEYHTQHRDGRPSDEGMNRYNPIKTVMDYQIYKR